MSERRRIIRRLVASIVTGIVFVIGAKVLDDDSGSLFAVYLWLLACTLFTVVYQRTIDAPKEKAR